MTETTTPRVRRALWATFFIFVVFGALLGYVTRHHRRVSLAPAAYLVPADGDAYAGTAKLAAPLRKPRVLASGEEVRIAAGARVRLLTPGGKVQDFTGPALIRVAPYRAAERDPLWAPLEDVERLTAGDARKQPPGVEIWSPFGVTQFTNPTLDWAAKEGVRYDVAVIDPADGDAPLKLIRDVVPPLRVSNLDTTGYRRLRKDRLYRVLVREAGKQDTLGVSPILVAPEAPEQEKWEGPADRLCDAFTGMAILPRKTGDAYVALKGLPLGWRESELGLRLRLAVALELGQGDEAGVCLRKLKQL